MQHVIALFRKGPYGQINSLEGIRAVEGLLVFDIKTDVVFIDDGVFNLVKNQKPEGIGHHSILLVLDALHRYDIPIIALKPALEERGIKPSDLEQSFDVRIITVDELSDMLLKADVTIAF